MDREVTHSNGDENLHIEPHEGFTDQRDPTWWRSGSPQRQRVHQVKVVCIVERVLDPRPSDARGWKSCLTPRSDPTTRKWSSNGDRGARGSSPRSPLEAGSRKGDGPGRVNSKMPTQSLGHTSALRQTVRRGDPDSQALQVIETQPYIEPQTKPFKLFTKKAGGDASPKEDNQSARHAARPSYKDEKAVEEAELQRRAICEEILVSGCVQSFVDFFYLMHRPDPKAAEREDGTAGLYILLPTSEMVSIKDNLMKAELARRKGETEVAFAAFEALAEYFRDMEDAKTAVYFYEKCSELARLTGDKGRQMLSNNRLGDVYDKAGDLGSAIDYHEKHRELAIAESMRKEVLKANGELVKVYMKFAHQKEEAGNYEDAIRFFEKALDAAKKSEDVGAEGKACYRLGSAYIKAKSNYDVAIKYLLQYEMIASSLKDMEGAGRAFEALATAHQRLGDDEKGVTFLENFLKMATSTNNLRGQGEACSNLGVILSRRRQYKMAVTNFVRHYEISRDMVQSSQGSMAQLEQARVYLGIARGNAMLNGYVAAVTGDMPTLLDWKINMNDQKISARR